MPRKRKEAGRAPFGATKAVHREAVAAHHNMVTWALVEAQKAKRAGRCDLVRDYAFSAFDAAAKMSAHAVAENLSRKNEQGVIRMTKQYQTQARNLIESCR